jgi:hypothetical protein
MSNFEILKYFLENFLKKYKVWTFIFCHKNVTTKYLDVNLIYIQIYLTSYIMSLLLLFFIDVIFIKHVTFYTVTKKAPTYFYKNKKFLSSQKKHTFFSKSDDNGHNGQKKRVFPRLFQDFQKWTKINVQN